ncbi:MAG TPA: ankyrin repeat domain-containing protein [Jatrophihabitans sp.]|nr:ankyrin repeat domain-containing protein [Jatrophihabitans sp.]
MTGHQDETEQSHERDGADFPAPAPSPAPADFIAAVAAGEVNTVRAALDLDPLLLRAAGPQGESLALTALYHGHVQLADELAARAGELSVFEAAAFDDIDRLAALLRGQPELVSAWSADGWQPLHLAAFFGRVEAARTLLDADAPVTEASRSTQAVFPLHSAAAGRHTELVWLLIASDAPVDARQQGGWTALHAAAANGDAASVQALVAAGADVALTTDDGRTAAELTTDGDVRAALAAAL